ncbi:esterase/lipase family protein [Intestinirhabdus alba]|jgi:pimeloyl-ACP methyl ester carboxylesterase|uniref:Acetyltransferase n=1 Tax=Intestinirhabdus alba TaxID=2899544 RepID=A0A6L6IKT3_9ENTR|nr:acetyltransferase [Intestinirhabdus alba]MTH45660.1 acetyltransferase [Intestinirhabdus alba]
MTEENNQTITWHKPEWNEQGKCIWRSIQTRPASERAIAKLLAPPAKVIPVIFLPGVMGSNLMSTQKSETSVWRGDSEVSVLFDWAGKSGIQRRQLLDPDLTVVDSAGKISKEIFSPVSDDGCLFPPRSKRGWGEVLYFSYGKFLSVFQGALIDDWQKSLDALYQAGKAGKTAEPAAGALSQLVEVMLHTEEENESPLTAEELAHFRGFLFPLHVFGYNWLQDNKISAQRLGEYIDEVLDLYRHQHGHGLATEKVILVTHSMGGLVARYTSQVLGYQDKILGIVHGVIPDLGSPAAYRRMKVGAGQEGPAGVVMGKSAEELMPVLARAPAPLQLLPSASYYDGRPWLTIKGGEADGSDLKLPKEGDPFGEIYLNKTLWWRLYEADVIDKDRIVIEKNWNAYLDLMGKFVQPFIDDIENAYHPNSYLFYGNSSKTDGNLIWIKTSITWPKNTHESDKKLPNNHREIPLPFNRSTLFKLVSSGSPGDGTVPVESLRAIRRSATLKSALAVNVEHQGAYNVDSLRDIDNRPAVRFTLRAIVKMVQEVPASW